MAPAAPELFDKHLPVLTAVPAVSARCAKSHGCIPGAGLEELCSWGNTIHLGLSVPMWFAQGLAAPAEVVPCIVAAPGDGRSCVRGESVPEGSSLLNPFNQARIAGGQPWIKHLKLSSLS